MQSSIFCLFSLNSLHSEMFGMSIFPFSHLIFISNTHGGFSEMFWSSCAQAACAQGNALK